MDSARQFNLFSFIQRYPAVTLLTAAIILVQLATYVYGSGATDFATAQRFGALQSGDTSPEEWFRLATHLFVQIGGTPHLGSNLLCLIAFGPLLEKIYGSVKFLFLYFVTGMFGGIFILLFSSHVIAAGASGSLFGLMGLYLGLIIKQHRLMDLKNRAIIWSTCIINIVYTFSAPNISIAAHLGGLFSGFILSFIVPTQSISRARERNFLLEVGKLLLFAMIWFGLLNLPQYLPDSIKKSPVITKVATQTNQFASRIKERLPGNQKGEIIDDANWLNNRYNKMLTMLNNLIDIYNESNKSASGNQFTADIENVRNDAEDLKTQVSTKELNADMDEAKQILLDMLTTLIQSTDDLETKVTTGDVASANKFSLAIHDIEAQTKRYHVTITDIGDQYGLEYQ